MISLFFLFYGHFKVTQVPCNDPINLCCDIFGSFAFSFVDLVQKKYAEITTERDTITKTLQAVEKGTVLAEQLKKELNREHLVLEQKNQVLLALILLFSCLMSFKHLQKMLHINLKWVPE